MTTKTRSRNVGFTLVELMVVIGILALLVGILAVAVIPKLTQAKASLELKQVGDIKSALDGLVTDDSKKKKLNYRDVKEKKGLKFYEVCFQKGILDREVIPKLVSLASGDTKADSSWIDNNEEFPEISCSYTGPKAGDVLALLRKTGAKKSVVLTFNSRNWNNYEDKGLLILWSEGQSAEYLSLDDFKQNDTWQVDESDWANAGAGLFGEKKPFQDTYE